MAVKAGDGSTTTAPALQLPPRLSSSSSPPTVGTLLTRASAAAATPRPRDCSSSPRSLLSRILHIGRGGGGGVGCRLRLFPRHCTSSATAATAREHVAAAAKGEVRVETREAVAPKVVGGQTAPHEESPRTSHGVPRAGKNSKATVAAEDVLPAASLGLGASLVLLLSKSAAELRRMAELRAQMERLMLDVRADVRSCNGRPSGSGDHADSSSVVKCPIAGAGDEEEGALSQLSDGSTTGAAPARENAGHRDMNQMEAELEAELLRLQQASRQDDIASPRRDRQLKGESDGKSTPSHGGVSARELERRLHELLQSRHEARIAELESELERARRKLRETEREASRWRDTAKLATRFTDESRLR
nr:unnamed protein product [Digitaria exilis]